MDQEEKEGKRERNDRVIVMPSWHDRLGEFENASELPTRLREEIAKGPATLLYGARDEKHNEAVVLQELLD